MRVPLFLAEQRVAFETIIHPPAFSAQKRAKVLRLPGSRVVKSVLLRGPSGLFLAVLPASHQVDPAALAEAFGGPVRLATSAEIAGVFCDCEWGVVPPFGALYGLRTMMDARLDLDALLIFEGHTHDQAIRMRGRDFDRLQKPLRLLFARPSHAATG